MDSPFLVAKNELASWSLSLKGLCLTQQYLRFILIGRILVEEKMIAGSVEQEKAG